MIDVKDTAQKVIDLLNERGWTQYRLQDNDGRLCVFGAVNMVLTGHYTWPGSRSGDMAGVLEFADALGPIVVRNFPERVPSSRLYLYSPQEWGQGRVVTFNNSPATSKEDVIGVLQELVNA
jgi:hypothetical protein